MTGWQCESVGKKSSAAVGDYSGRAANLAAKLDEANVEGANNGIRFMRESDQGKVAAKIGYVHDWARRLLRPRRGAPREAATIPMIGGGRATVGVAIGACLAICILAVDPAVIAEVRGLSHASIGLFQLITDFGKSGWVLFPAGFVLIGLAALPPLPRAAAVVAAAIAVRFGFLFTAIAVPGLVTLLIKQLIGRARPYAAAGETFVLHPLAFQAQYMSFPSGHSTTAFAAAVAISALWPRIGVIAVVWGYAFTIGLSRIIVSAHFASDVLASAAIGIIGALLVREYFANRRLAFTMAGDGRVRPSPGPSLRRLRRAVSALFAARSDIRR